MTASPFLSSPKLVVNPIQVLYTADHIFNCSPVKKNVKAKNTISLVINSLPASLRAYKLKTKIDINSLLIPFIAIKHFNLLQ